MECKAVITSKEHNRRSASIYIILFLCTYAVQQHLDNHESTTERDLRLLEDKFKAHTTATTKYIESRIAAMDNKIDAQNTRMKDKFSSVTTAAKKQMGIFKQYSYFNIIILYKL